MSAGAKSEDTVPASYPYAWTPDSDASIDDFVKKYRPSMVTDDGTKPWIWAVSSRHEPSKPIEKAIEEASALLQDITTKVEDIKNDDSIPARSSKKTGAKGKKEVREAVQAEATEKLKEISIRHGYVGGKWLIFAPPDRVDSVWTSVATSLVSGPLSHTAAHSAKVATSPRSENANYQHVLCIYMPDVYAKDTVLEIMTVLLREHGLNLSGVKSDLYTYIGLDSKHPSGVQSTVWKNRDLMPDAEMKALKDAYFAAPKDKPAASASSAAPAAPSAPALAPAKAAEPDAAAKPVPKKKKAADDPFASDDEEDDAPAEKKAAPPKKAPPKKKAKEEDMFEDDEEEKPASRAKPASKATAKPAPKKAKEADMFDDDDEEEKPAKARPASKSKPASKAAVKALPKKKAKEEDMLEDDEEEKPTSRAKPASKGTAKAPPKKKAKEADVFDEEDDEEKPVNRAKPASKVTATKPASKAAAKPSSKAAGKTKAAPKRKKSQEDDFEEDEEEEERPKKRGARR